MNYVAYLTIDKTPVEDLERRLEYMFALNNFSFEENFKKCHSLADALKYPFEQLPIYSRLKELIKRSTVFPIRTIEEYLKYVALNHTSPEMFKQTDFDLISHFNSKLILFFKNKYPKEYNIFTSSIINRLKQAFWFDREQSHWVNDELNNFFYTEAGY